MSEKWAKLSNLLDKTINKTVHNVVKVATSYVIYISFR